MNEELQIEKLKLEIEALIDSDKFLELNEYLDDVHPQDIAEIIEELDDKKIQRLFEVLPWEIAAKVLDEIDAETFLLIFKDFQEEQKINIISKMSTDDITDLLLQLPESEKEEIFSLLDQETLEDIKELMIYGEDTAGGIMTTEFVALSKDIDISRAIEYLRENAPEAETIYYTYVIDKWGKLVGVISLRELIIGKPETLIEEIMSSQVIYVNINDDQEEVARIVSKYDLLAVPVVDLQGKLRGIVTVDDVIDVIEEEATEDIYKFAGTSESESDFDEEDGFFERVFSSVKARLPWLVITLFGGILSATILGKYEDTLNSYTAVAFFMPLLTGMGGNVGTQSSTLTVRGLATGNVDMKKAFKTIFQEMSIGASVGMICSLMVFVVAMVWMKEIRLGIVVGIAMLANMITAATIGTTVPMIFKKFGVDPAVASAPFISTTLDITGLTIYFTLTTTILLHIT